MATVDELITDARGFAATSNTSAISLVQAAQSAISGIVTNFSIDGGPNIDTPPVDLVTVLPEFVNPEFNPGTPPTAPTNLVALPVLDTGTAPINTAVRPTLQEPAIPNQLRQFTTAPPSVNTSFAFPEVPAELRSISIVAPTLTERTVPVAPDLQIPLFNSAAPTEDITPPEDYAEQFMSAYRDISPTMVAALDGQMDTFISRYNPRYQAQLSALEDKLSQYLAGGTALAPTIENAIFERSKDKVNAEYRRTRDTAFGDAAKRGFTMPDGAVMSAVRQARQGGADNNARAAVEIAVKQAELEQQNIQFAVTTSAQLRNAVMSASLSYHSNLVQLNGQALDYAKSVMSAAIEVYNTLVKAFGLRLEAYKADVQVYEVRIRAVGAAIEIYRAQIAAMQAAVQVDLAKVDIYKARLEALSVLSGVYRNQVDAVIGQANIEKLKIELFGAQVQAYGIEAQAKSSEFQGYSALVNGQEARLRAYGEEVRAYVANVEGYRATVMAKQAEIEAIGQINRTTLGQYTAQLDGYRTLVDAQSRIATTAIDFQRTKLQAFQAQVSTNEAQARLTQEYYRTKATLGVENFRAVLQATIESAKLSTAQIAAVANTALGGAKVYEGLATAALSGMNTLVSSSTTT